MFYELSHEIKKKNENYILLTVQSLLIYYFTTFTLFSPQETESIFFSKLRAKKIKTENKPLRQVQYSPLDFVFPFHNSTNFVSQFNHRFTIGAKPFHNFGCELKRNKRINHSCDDAESQKKGSKV